MFVRFLKIILLKEDMFRAIFTVATLYPYKSVNQWFFIEASQSRNFETLHGVDVVRVYLRSLAVYSLSFRFRRARLIRYHALS